MAYTVGVTYLDPSNSSHTYDSGSDSTKEAAEARAMTIVASGFMIPGLGGGTAYPPSRILSAAVHEG